MILITPFPGFLVGVTAVGELSFQQLRVLWFRIPSINYLPSFLRLERSTKDLIGGDSLAKFEEIYAGSRRDKNHSWQIISGYFSMKNSGI